MVISRMLYMSVSSYMLYAQQHYFLHGHKIIIDEKINPNLDINPIQKG